MYEIINEPKNGIYSKLIDFLTIRCDSFILIKRDQLEFNQNCCKIIDLLKPYLIKKTNSNEWPGTKLFGHSAIIYSFECNCKTGLILKNACNGLYSWLSPDLPEDICFYISDEPFLITISHEKTGILKNINRKVEIFKKELPEIKLEFHMENELKYRNLLEYWKNKIKNHFDNVSFKTNVNFEDSADEEYFLFMNYDDNKIIPYGFYDDCGFGIGLHYKERKISHAYYFDEIGIKNNFEEMVVKILIDILYGVKIFIEVEKMNITIGFSQYTGIENLPGFSDYKKYSIFEINALEK